MKISSLFTQAFALGMRQWRVTSIVYVFQFCLVITLGMQVHSVLESSIGHSLELNKLLNGYDHTVITDFLKVHGASITPLIGQLRWLLLTWFGFSVFLDAGLLFCVVNKQDTIQSPGQNFWLGAARLFFPFLKISLIFILIALLGTLLLWGPVALLFEPSLHYFSSEIYTVWMVISLLGLYLFGLLGLFIWSVLSRIILIQTGASIPKSIQQARKNFWKNKRSYLGIMFAFIALQIGLLAVYGLLKCLFVHDTVVDILVLFIVQQLFIFFRIQIRQMMYAGISNAY